MGIYDAASKCWLGPKVDRTCEKSTTFRETLIKSFRANPNKVFQISHDEGTKLTFKEVEKLAVTIGRNLKKFGLKKGDVVSTLMPNSTYVAPIAFGCFLNGIALAPFNFRQGIARETLQNAFNIAKPKAIIVEEFVEQIEVILQVINDMELDCKIFTVGRDKKYCSANIFPLCELLVGKGDDE